MMTNIHILMQEQFDLAKTYAEDGAFRSAARILGDLTSSVQAHAEWCDACLAELMARVPEEECPGHVASIMDPKVCGRCGTHVDSLRPDDDPINLAGSGPVPIEPREG